MSDFCHLHLHSEHSILDGYTRTHEVPAVAKALGQTAVALTDHGSLGGALKFYKAAKEQEIKHIFGVEGYVTEDHSVKDKDSSTWHIILLAHNRTGLNNLFALSRIGWTDGFYKKPRVDHGVLSSYSDGLIATTSCMGGEVARAIEQNDLDKAVAALRSYSSIFPGRLYVELQPGNDRELNATLAMLADDLRLPTVVAVDSHYDTDENASEAELLLTMQQAAGFKPADKEFARYNYESARRESSTMARLNKLWPNRNLRFDKLDLHIMSRAEVVERMNKQGFYGNDLADATLEIAERCESVEIQTGVNYLPKLSAGETSDNKLARLVREGLQARDLWSRPEYIERAKEELKVIADKQFADYFLVVHDLVSEARRRNIYVGPGRGSAAGSLISYALKITNIDPVKYGLLFFRFINPERNDFPDIDIDFEHRGRDEMKDYMREKYGEALSLSTYTQLKAKSSIKSIAKALAIPYDEVDGVTKHFSTLEEYKDSDVKELVAFKNRHPELLHLAEKLENHISAAGMHASALVVADRPMHEIVPIETRADPQDKKKRVAVAAYDMNDAAEVGLIKLDFLGLINLSMIHDCVDLVKERHNIDIDWENLEPDDRNVLDELGRGNTIGVFQMESGQYRRLLKEMRIDSFEDLVASNALVRPGAFETVAKSYIKRQNGLERVVFPHEDVEEELKGTYGTYIYQEQVMQLTVKLGKFSWAKADKLRKIIGKKLSKEEFAPYYDPWIAEAGEKIGFKAAEDMWKNFEKHSGYSFNRSHAVAYSYIGYVTAWLKYYYPLEYLYALLKNEKHDTTRTSYLLEARRLGIEVLPPDVNKSQEEMSIDGNNLRFGLSDIKLVGVAACQEIISKRPFSSWSDFSDRITARKCNSRVVASLVAVDALASLEDAPRHPEPTLNYQEYLNYPIALESASTLGLVFTDLEDHDESSKDFILVRAVVKAIKRTERYVRVELEDLTSTATAFASMNCDLKSGEVIIAIIGDKTLVGYARPEELKHQAAKEEPNYSGFESYIMSKSLEKYGVLRSFGFGGFSNPDKCLAVPLQVREVTTKTGKKMCFAYVGDGENIIKLTIFPQQWPSAKTKLFEWEPVCLKLGFTDDGSFTLARGDSIIGATEVLNAINKKMENK